ncbi:MAG: ATP-binding cassette domain-containing protein [Gammaproteobacteria bacterium]
MWFLGPSGAGKSTLLRTVNGLVSNTRGQIVIGGVEVSARTLRRLRPRMAMIHQQFNLVTPRDCGGECACGRVA